MFAYPSNLLLLSLILIRERDEWTGLPQTWLKFNFQTRPNTGVPFVPVLVLTVLVLPYPSKPTLRILFGGGTISWVYHNCLQLFHEKLSHQVKTVYTTMQQAHKQWYLNKARLRFI